MSILRTLLLLQIGLAVVAASAAQTTRSPASQVEWRQEYNAVAAAIDTLMRLHGSKSLERLTDSSQAPQSGVGEDPLVLLFWADDEAEVFLNGYPVARTRLTPTRVEIPRFYIQDQNLLRVHCWDTDSVESGFMAGLYVQESGGDLRSVIVTSEESLWQTEGGPAQEIFYTHSIPDIPGAKVVWGDHLFGDFWLEKRFSRAAVADAAHKLDSVPPPSAQPRSMEFHQVVSRLVSLENRRDHIVEQLGGSKRANIYPRYRGRLARPTVAFTLGRTAVLTEGVNTKTSERLQKWAQRLPVKQRELVLQPQRHLKGWQAATPAVILGDRPSASSTKEDRRLDYRPPPESSAGNHAVYVQPKAIPQGSRPQPVRQAWLGLITLFLASYFASASWQWWRLFNSTEWT